ncbi:hypothetical protein AYO38_02975 [bacterium SCGC AG-212-C10]|nr:hypothetical protein AYO38_02975 [bacterium SCGC AG-212-C10]
MALIFRCSLVLMVAVAGIVVVSRVDAASSAGADCIGPACMGVRLESSVRETPADLVVAIAPSPGEVRAA